MIQSDSLVETAAVLLASPDLQAGLAGVAELLRRDGDVLRVGVAMVEPDRDWLRVIEVRGDGAGPAEAGGARLPRAGTANGHVVETGLSHVNAAVAEQQRFLEERLLASAGAQAYVCVPASFGGEVLGTLNVALRTLGVDDVERELLPGLVLVGEMLGAALERERLGIEVRRLTAALRRRGEVLDAELDRLGATRPVAESEAFRKVLREVERAAVADLSVLFVGETGTGKEVLARQLHRSGPRAEGPFVAVNCAALPDALAESELFGVRKGAFTGAERDRSGVFETANGGTLFLDEVGDLSLSAQAKLLRAAQEGLVTPLGGTAPVHVDVRLVSATHRDLRSMIVSGTFREDLYHRLAALPIRVPPLSDRREDIPGLVEQFVRAACARMNRHPPSISSTLMRMLAAREFPGNVRELRNLVERAVVFSGEVLVLPEEELRRVGDEVTAAVPAAALEAPGDWPTLADAQAAHIRATLKRTDGRIYGPSGAAALLGMPPSTLKSRMERLGMA